MLNILPCMGLTMLSRREVNRTSLAMRPLVNCQSKEISVLRNGSATAYILNHCRVSSSVTVPQNEPKKSKGRVRMPSGDWTQIELDTTSAISPATQILGDALRTNAPEVRCMICKTMTASEYGSHSIPTIAIEYIM
ncbi:hypothetical protein NECAME_18113 [Necator americanus]|uniref:Uncharacterized protein n=1 Tax=Necator americanus TaxID=51031 RepID=W2TEU1_NECAM|nr:hypothetical protein NECAME_18113 [Necator americanus]ETN79527.1 hypothetical protein NECAME_18113 [Necator americanus]